MIGVGLGVKKGWIHITWNLSGKIVSYQLSWRYGYYAKNSPCFTDKITMIVQNEQKTTESMLILGKN